MTATISEMSPEELRELVRAVVEATVERKLLELLGDPDEGLALRRRVRDKLLRQQQAVAAGERGQSLEDAIRVHGWE